MSAFERLAPFIQEYIYRHRWRELHEIQVAACDIIFNTDDNLLLATPTASGKTEAAFLPVITEIYNNPPSTVGVLYVSPLKALINDQFLRIEELLAEADIPVTKWHGDAPQSAKDKIVQKPKGVLQITPESLEAMLMRRRPHIMALFADLRFIIIDEVHQFIWSDRGVQLSSILERIQGLTGNIPRRIGLSATLGDMSIAEEWLNNGTNRACSSPEVNAGRRKAQMMVDHIYTMAGGVPTGAPGGAQSGASNGAPNGVQSGASVDNADSAPGATTDGSAAPDNASYDKSASFFETLYYLTRGKKSIIFSNSREEIEVNINRLKLLAESKKERDVFHVHHGNISADGREYAEEQMRESDMPLVTGATVTLELGIDLGDLERIVQTGAPHSVSSLTQRLGRSGRRSGVSQMCFVFQEDEPTTGDMFIHTINWPFIKCLALIELYRENWLEPFRTEKYPYSVLFHQTLSVLYGYGDTTPSQLARRILSERTFRYVSQDDFKELLMNMIETGMLEITGESKIALGKKGEWLTNHHEFYAVFETPDEYSVHDGANQIGTLHHPIPIGERFVLSGKTWEVTDIDKDRKGIYVKYVGGKSDVAWDTTTIGDVHTRVLHKMREIITGAEPYGYLSARAAARLAEIRLTIKQTGSFADELQTDIFSISPNRFGICPWLGTRALNALSYCIRYKKIRLLNPEPDWVYLIAETDDIEDLRDALREIKVSQIAAEELPLPDTLPNMGKYGPYVPKSLSRKQYLDRYIDLDEMRAQLRVLSSALSRGVE